MNKRYTLSQEVIGSTSLLSVGALYGLSAVIAKYLSGSINAYQVIEYRFGIAFLAVALLMLLLKQPFTLKKVSKRVLFAFAITFPGSAILFTLSVFHASVALAVFSFYTANLIAQFTLGYLLFKEKIDMHKGLAFIAAIAALIAFTNPLGNFTISLGLIFGLIAGIVQGIASIFQKMLSNSTNRASLLVIQTFAGIPMAVVILLLSGQSLTPGMSSFTWLITCAFGLIMLGIMYLFLIGYKYTKLNVGSILVSSELFWGPIFAYLLLSEHIATSTITGGIFTVIAAILINLPAIKINPTSVKRVTKKSFKLS